MSSQLTIYSVFVQKPAFIEICKSLDNKSLNAFLQTCKLFTTWQGSAMEKNNVFQQDCTSELKSV